MKRYLLVLTSFLLIFGIVAIFIVNQTDQAEGDTTSIIEKSWNPWDYDTNSDNAISKQEALNAVVDFFSGQISKQEALEVIVLFFEGGPDTYNLQISSSTGGSVTTPGEGIFPYHPGSIVNLITAPDNGYYFTNWSGDTATIAAPGSPNSTITMNGNYSITANFQQGTPQYYLTIDSTSGGNVNTPGEGVFGPYDEGTVVDIIAVSNTGYEWANWTVDTWNIANPNQATTTITMNGNYSITANFVVLGAVATRDLPDGFVMTGTQFDVTVNVTDCGIAGQIAETLPNGFTYVSITDPGGDFIVVVTGQTVKITFLGNAADITYQVQAHTVEGIYPFNGVVEDDAHIERSITGDYEVNVIAPGTTYDLTVASSTGGSVTAPGEGTFPYNPGSIANLVASADTGFVFTEWTGDISTIANVNNPTTTITMNSVYSVTANFEQQHTLVMNKTGNGSVAPVIGSHVCDVGEIVNLVAIPDSGWLFGGWSGDTGTIANAGSPVTAITMHGDYSITANFIQRHTLTMNKSGNGSTHPQIGTHVYDMGEIVNLAAGPSSGWQFDGWTGDIGTIVNAGSPITTITINGDYSITANFTTSGGGWDPWSYDTDYDLVMSQQEALSAVVDFFNELITKQQALEVIVLFFG